MFSLAAFYSQLFIHNFYARLAQKFHFLESFIYFITRINLSRTRGLLTDELQFENVTRILVENKFRPDLRHDYNRFISNVTEGLLSYIISNEKNATNKSRNIILRIYITDIFHRK